MAKPQRGRGQIPKVGVAKPLKGRGQITEGAGLVAWTSFEVPGHQNNMGRRGGEGAAVKL